MSDPLQQCVPSTKQAKGDGGAIAILQIILTIALYLFYHSVSCSGGSRIRFTKFPLPQTHLPLFPRECHQQISSFIRSGRHAPRAALAPRQIRVKHPEGSRNSWVPPLNQSLRRRPTISSSALLFSSFLLLHLPQHQHPSISSIFPIISFIVSCHHHQHQPPSSSNPLIPISSSPPLHRSHGSARGRRHHATSSISDGCC